MLNREEQVDNCVDVVGPTEQNVEVDLENPFVEVLTGFGIEHLQCSGVKIVFGSNAENLLAIEAEDDNGANQREWPFVRVVGDDLRGVHVRILLFLFVFVITSPAELPLTFESGGKTLFFGYMRLFLGIEILPKQIKPERGLDETYGVALSGNW